MHSTLEGAMNLGRLLLALIVASLLVISADTVPMALAIPRPDGCRRVTTTGPAFIAHNCYHARRIVRVDNRPVIHNPHRTVKSSRWERPIDRLLTRGDGRIKAHGDKAARRELREKARRGS
jgi:hypothetical protein